MNLWAGAFAAVGAAAGLGVGVLVNRARKSKGVNVPLVGAGLGALAALVVTDRRKGTWFT